jgi:prepilin-type N-terminal cleavage/methylation domain-containing protein
VASAALRPVSRITHHASRFTFHVSRVPPRAFTLVEILVTMALLSFIVVGLFATLNQVQRAFRSGMAQVDRLEAGRAVTEMLPRELEQITPCNANTVTFSTRMIPGTPLTQSLPGMPTGTSPAVTSRTNLLQDCFILMRQNQSWVGIGYCVRINDPNDPNGKLVLPETALGSGKLGAGSLYRFVTTTNVLRSDGTPSDPGVLYSNFVNAAQSGLGISNRICDGVIHFYLGAYATNGYQLSLGTRSGTNVACFRPDPYSVNPLYTVVHPTQVIPGPGYPGNLAELRFRSNAVPAVVELQLGILEQPAWERYDSIPVPAARWAYLQRADVCSRVHLFRQRATVRNVDPLAYQ